MGRRQVAGPCRIRRRQCHGARTRGHAVIAVHQQRPESALHGPRDAHGVPAWRGVDPPGQSLQAPALRALRPDRRDRGGQSG
jgi:hypothetical protein